MYDTGTVYTLMSCVCMFVMCASDPGRAPPGVQHPAAGAQDARLSPAPAPRGTQVGVCGVHLCLIAVSRNL